MVELLKAFALIGFIVVLNMASKNELGPVVEALISGLGWVVWACVGLFLLAGGLQVYVSVSAHREAARNRARIEGGEG